MPKTLWVLQQARLNKENYMFESSSPSSCFSTKKQFLRKQQQGFTLIEVLVASGLLSFALVVMFGLHSQALRSNMHAKRMTDCTYLAQAKLERLLALPWRDTSIHTHLTDALGSDPTSNSSAWLYLEHPSSLAEPPEINAANGASVALGPKLYSVTWDVEMMDSPDDTWSRIRVRCQYQDRAFNHWHGTTVSSYRFRDN
jgi:prepilin-type N-terminal cleavage/methylation domain-containing protein